MKGQGQAFLGPVRRFVQVALTLLALAMWLAPAVARACKCGQADAALVAAPFFKDPTALVAGPETLSLDCSRAECVWRSTHVFENTGNAELRTQVLLVSALVSDVELLVGATAVELGPSRELLRGTAEEDPSKVDPDLPGVHQAMSIETWAGTDAVVRATSIAIPANTSIKVTITAVARPERWECSCGFWGMRARHLLTTRLDTKRILAFTHLQDLPKRHDGSLAVQVKGPPREALTIRAGASTTRSRRARANVDLPAQTQKLHVSLARDFADFRLVPRALAGGPFVAVGGGFGDARGLRLRGGYEMAAPQFLALAAAVESDAKRHVVVIPSAELVPPWGMVLSIFPMPALGFGAPIQVWPNTRVGFRTQVSLGWYFFTIVGSFDLYPEMGGDGRMLRGGLLAQFSI